MNSNVSPAGGAAVAGFFAGYFLVAIGIMVLTIVCYWKIFTKAGFNGALALLALIPCAQFILLIWFAFTEWPVESQNRMGGGGPMGPSPYYRAGPGGYPPATPPQS